jgi:tetratricopeptide (TPR) repeat protein
LALDSGSAKAIANLAHEQSVRFWRWNEGERELRRALALEPRRAEIWNLLGVQLRILGRFPDAVAAFRRARELDPMSRHYSYQVAHAFRCAGQPDSALAALRTAIALGTRFPAAHEAAAAALASLGRYDEAVAEWGRAAVLLGDSALAGELQQAQGREAFNQTMRAAARRAVRDLEALPAGRYVRPTRRAEIYAAAGDLPGALAWLEHAHEDRDPNLPMIGCFPGYDALRTHPRFVTLVRAMDLPREAFGTRPAVVVGTLWTPMR